MKLFLLGKDLALSFRMNLPPLSSRFSQGQSGKKWLRLPQLKQVLTRCLPLKPLELFLLKLGLEFFLLQNCLEARAMLMLIIFRIFGVAFLIFFFFLFFHNNLGLQGEVGLLSPLRMEHRIVGGLVQDPHCNKLIQHFT